MTGKKGIALPATVQSQMSFQMSYSVHHCSCAHLDPGGLISGQRQHQRLFFLSSAQQICEHEGREEPKLHHEAELKQLEVDAEHPLKYSRQVIVVVLFLGKQNCV